MKDIPAAYKNAGYLNSTNDLNQQSNGDLLHPLGRKYGTLPLSKSRLGGSMTSLDMQTGGTFTR